LAKSKVWLALVSLLLAAALVLAGCSSKTKSPQEALQASLVKSGEIKSQSFSGSVKIEEWDIPETAGDAGMLNMLKDAEISWTGAYRADPMHAEMTLTLALKGDLSFNLNIPVVVTEDKVWVKIPSIPLLPLPDGVTGKFLELDLKELAEETGEAAPSFDLAQNQKFTNELLSIVFKHIDEKTYFTNVKVEEAGLPDSVKAKQVIRFQLSKEQVEPLLKTAIEKILPEFFNLLSTNEEYRALIGISDEELQEAKKGLEEAGQKDFSESMAEFNKSVKALSATSNFAIDEKEYLVYSDFQFRIEVEEEGQTGAIALKGVSEVKDINADVKLEYEGGPKDVITMKQFEEQMGGLFLGGDF
jgi:hypothetical protein